MVKKLGIGLLIVALAFFAFMLVQKGKLEEKLTALLQSKNVQVERSAVNLLPSPSIELQKIRYGLNENYHLSADNLNLNLSWWGILTAHSEIADIQLNNGTVFADSIIKLKAINGTITPIDFSLSELPILIEQHKAEESWENIIPKVQLNLSVLTEQDDKLTLKASQLGVMKNELHWQDLQAELALNNRRLFNTNKLAITAKNGSVNWLDNNYNIRTDLAINQLQFKQLEGDFETQPDIQGHAILFGMNGEHVEFVFSPLSLMLKSEQFPLQPLLDTFNIPVLITGKVNGEARLFAEDYFPTEGEIRAEVTGGELNGLNLLELVSQYAPINYDDEQLKQKTNSTHFDRIFTHFYWKPTELYIKNTELFHQRFIVHSAGNIDLTNGKCDVNAEIAVNDRRFDLLKLPVHFFGDCQSPQYKVEFDRTFRDQLREFIKEKLR